MHVQCPLQDASLDAYLSRSLSRGLFAWISRCPACDVLFSCLVSHWADGAVPFDGTWICECMSVYACIIYIYIYIYIYLYSSFDVHM